MPRLPEHLQEHLERPRHVGRPEAGCDLIGRARNPACGDVVEVYLATGEGRVVEAGFKAAGCPAALGTASAATELVVGLDTAPDLPDQLATRFDARYGPPRTMHRHALTLFVDALRDALGSAPA